MRILILLVVIFCAYGCAGTGMAGIKEYLTTPRNLSYWDQLGPDYVKCHKTMEVKFCRKHGPYMICQCYAKNQ